MSQQERREGVRANTGDVKRRCEDDTHTHTQTQETETHTQNPQRREKGGETETKRVEEFNESPVPLNCTAGACGARVYVDASKRVCVYACVRACVYPPLKHWAVHNLSDSCQLCTPIYSASQILCQQGARPAGMTATETV